MLKLKRAYDPVSMVDGRRFLVERLWPRGLSKPKAWRPILSAARRGTVTLIYSSHDTEHNNAVALQGYLQAKTRRRAVSGRSAADQPRRSAR